VTGDAHSRQATATEGEGEVRGRQGYHGSRHAEGLSERGGQQSRVAEEKKC